MKRSRLTRTTPLRSDPESTRRWERRTRTELKRTELKRTTALRPRNPARRQKEWKRAYGSEDRVKWVQAQPCLVCGCIPSENAHIETGGKGRKADADLVVPLCPLHHTDPVEGYDHNKATFEEAHALDLHEEARKLEKRWQAHQEAA